MNSTEEKTQEDLAWESLRDRLEKQFGRRPDMQGILFLIGHRELGQLRTKFSRVAKQELIHVGVCSLLAREGYYHFVARDEDGWPHFERSPNNPPMSGKEQEQLLRRLALAYFETL